MKAFTDEEFRLMIFELTEKDPISFDMLCSIADRFLRPKVRRWCFVDPVLKAADAENDLMQDIFVRLIKTCVTGFLKREGPAGPVNDDILGFCKWMYTVAENLKIDMVKKISRATAGVSDIEEKSGEIGYYDKSMFEKRSEIDECFTIAASANKKPCIRLTWLAQSLLVVYYGFTKIEATQFMVDKWSGKTLFFLWSWVKKNMIDVPWLTFRNEWDERMLNELNMISDDGIKVGECKYEEFFNQRGGKATISDWVNRMNNLIKGQKGYEPFDN